MRKTIQTLLPHGSLSQRLRMGQENGMKLPPLLKSRPIALPARSSMITIRMECAVRYG